jgi:CxxC-x17-CxxC domain-containing protein
LFLLGTAKSNRKVTKGINFMSLNESPPFPTIVKRLSEEDFQDCAIRCIDCGQDFIWTAGEQLFFHDKGLKNPPKRCKPCKKAKSDRIASIMAAQESGAKQRVEVMVKCAKCGIQTTVPFYPSQGRPVLCRACFLTIKNNNYFER